MDNDVNKMDWRRSFSGVGAAEMGRYHVLDRLKPLWSLLAGAKTTADCLQGSTLFEVNINTSGYSVHSVEMSNHPLSPEPISDCFSSSAEPQQGSRE